jgi:hypothetical protein
VKLPDIANFAIAEAGGLFTGQTSQVN